MENFMLRIHKVLFYLLLVTCSVSIASQNKPLSKPNKEKTPLSTQKINTSGFSFLIEPAPSWVQSIVFDKNINSNQSTPIQILLSDQQINLELKKQSSFIHMIKRVNTGAGLNTGSQIQIEFDPAYQNLAIHKIELIRNDERIEKLDPRRIQLLQRETQLEARLYDGRVTASIVLDDVRVGDQIEYSYTIRGSNPVFDGKFAFIDNSGSSVGSTTQYSLRISYPSTRIINYRTPKNVIVEFEKNDLTQVLRFHQKNIPQYIYEESSSTSYFINQFIQLSEFQNWNEVALWGNELFKVAYVDDEKITKQVNEWRKFPSQKEQLNAALNFVQKEIRYFGTEIGVNSHKPDLPYKIMKQRYGDCKDKTSLLIALLKALNISASPALASTVFREETGELLPSPLAFNHVIAGVDIDGKRLWLDSTRDQQTGSAEEREVRDYGMVLLTQEQSNELLMLPNSIKEIHKTVEDYFSLIEMKNDPLLISTTTYYGELAESIRNYLAHTPIEEVQVNHAKPYMRPYPKLRLNGELKLQEVEGKNAIQLIQKFNLKELWQIKKFDVIKADLIFWSLEDELYSPQEVTRKTPFKIRQPGIYRHSIISEFSEELLDSYKEEKFVDGQANFSLIGTWSSTNKKATWSTELHYLSRNVQVNQWRSYADKVKQVRHHFYYQLLAHALTEEQIKNLEKDFADIEKNSRLFSIPMLKTSKIMILYVNAMLASGRLSPELKKSALMIRSSAELTLKFYQHSAQDINAVLDLMTEPDSEVLSLAALVAFANKNDSAAREFIDRALEIAPHEKKLHELNLILEYFSDNHQSVIDKSTELLNSRDPIYSYFGLMRYLSQRKLNIQNTNELKNQLDDGYSNEDTTKLLNFYLGKKDLNQISPKFSFDDIDLMQLTRIYFFAAEKMYADGNIKGAKENWKGVISLGLAHRFEYIGASRRLEMFEKEKNN